MIGVGAVVSALMQILANLKVAAGSVASYFRVGAGATTLGASLSLALIGIGHLVGPAVGIAMIVGLVISFFVLLPIWTGGHVPSGIDLSSVVDPAFSNDVRLIGAGVMAIAAVWTLVKIIGPIISGIVESFRSSRARKSGVEVDITEKDIPASIVVGTILVFIIPIALLLYMFIRDEKTQVLAQNPWGILIVAVVFVVLVGLFVAAVCGYMAGLIGASNSPVSGVGILVALIGALLLKSVWGVVSGDQVNALIAYTLFTTAVVFGIATISNDNLQDLKTGQLVGATPWKQQVALIIGVVFGSLVIPPVMGLMATSFGFAGAPGAGENALAAPQASLIATLVQGVIGQELDWSLLGIGAAIGVVVIVVNELLSHYTKRFSLPPLAVGMGMYLPSSLTVLIPVGAFIGYFYDRWAEKTRRPEATKRLGILLATGLIVGESLWGVIYAAIVGFSGSDSPLAILGDSYSAGSWVGVIVFILMVVGCYRMIQTMGKKDTNAQQVESVK